MHLIENICFQFIFIPLGPGVPTQCKATCSKSGTIGDFLESAGKLVNVPADRLVATDVFNSRYSFIISIACDYYKCIRKETNINKL